MPFVNFWLIKWKAKANCSFESFPQSLVSQRALHRDAREILKNPHFSKYSPV